MKRLMILLFVCCLVFVGCGETKGKEANVENETEEKKEEIAQEDNGNTAETTEEPISEFEKYKNECLETASEFEYSDENMAEIIVQLKEAYSGMMDLKFQKLAESDSAKEFVVSISYILVNSEDGTVGYDISNIGWDIVETIYNLDEKSFRKKMKEFKDTWDKNMDEKLYEKIYREGQYKVGNDIPAGEYVFFTDGSGYFCISKDSNGEDIIANENFDYNSIITLKKGDYLELSSCYAVPIKDAKVDKKKATMIKVGKHIKSGEYKLKCENGEEGYYCIYSDSRQQDIKANDNFKKQSYVTVKDGEYLLLSRCHIE